ncbi:concanavalin A-like lectin protein kinase family protein [Striga asiatica]|uniref:Concanavalin A-like lectin protein kinase family protein n=1 Tax=Striga asiatica TaxID=4170 RepID=A0A5A7P7I6_STRAF|nr:concanavalin A-like lectin protein kinase family protein [Striga asiatica]
MPMEYQLLLLSLNPLCLSQKCHPLGSLSIRIELQHHIQILQWVLLQGGPLSLLLDRLHHRLHLIGVDDPGQVSIDHLGPWQNITLLLLRELIKSSINLVELLKGRLGPDDEPPKMATRGKLEKVQAGDVGNLNTWDVAESLDEFCSLSSINHERPFPGYVAADFHGGASLLRSLSSIGDDEGKLGNLLNPVPAGKHKRGDGRRGNGGDNCVALLGDVDGPVPAAPDLGRREHPPATAHVPEGSLAGAVGAAAGDAGDTGDSAAGSPGLGGGLVTGASGDCVGLAGVVGDLAVDEGHDVGADGSLHHVGEGHGVDAGGASIGGHVVLQRLDGDEGTGGGGGHFGIFGVMGK